jgi:hypothetical protein
LSRFTFAIFCCLAVWLIATPAYANIGVPMIFITLPMMVVGLIPVIGIETFVFRKKLAVSLRQTVRTVTVINLVSTLIGIPLTWFLLVVLQIVTGGGGAHGLKTLHAKFLAVTWQAPWLIPYETDMYWMIPSAILFLLIPFFFASWLVEYQVAWRILRDFDRKDVKKAVFWANLITYLIFVQITVAWLAVSVQLH